MQFMIPELKYHCAEKKKSMMNIHDDHFYENLVSRRYWILFRISLLKKKKVVINHRD